MKSKITILAAVLVLAAALFAYLKLKPERNAELKSSDEIAAKAIDSAARASVEAAIEAINAMNTRKLMALMSKHDEVMLQKYAENLFQGKAFLPAEIKSARRLKNSTTGGLVVIVHSTTRSRNYEFSLVPKNGKFHIKGIRETQGVN